MKIEPELVLRRLKPKCKVSVILLDWNVRESFHSLHYLNQQTAPRDSYELIWLEFYRRKPAKLMQMVWSQGQDEPLLDQWLVAGYPRDYIFNKHRLYNLGILSAQGEICVICDSDAMFMPTFIEKIIAAFADGQSRVVHLDEVRNNDRMLYPFRYPPLEEVLGNGAINWHGEVTRGLDESQDMLHDANYGACMAARKADMMAVGGADEHLDYLGYVCGPYDLTFRLVNHGMPEVWLRDEFLYHTWHPNETGINTDYQGPHDGRCMSLRSLQARRTGQVEPSLENPWIAQARAGDALEAESLVAQLAKVPEPSWRNGKQPRSNEVYWVEADYYGFNIYWHRGQWIGIKVEDGAYDPRRRWHYRPMIRRKDIREVQHLVEFYHRLPTNRWERLASRPFSELPKRAWNWMGRELARWR